MKKFLIIYGLCLLFVVLLPVVCWAIPAFVNWQWVGLWEFVGNGRVLRFEMLTALLIAGFYYIVRNARF